jgi:hypothetical protein
LFMYIINEYRTRKDYSRSNILLSGLIGSLLLISCHGPLAKKPHTASMSDSREARAHDARGAAVARTKAEVEDVLWLDAKTGSLVDYTARVAAMRAIGLSGCPSDFKAAYTDHILAWEQAAVLQRRFADLTGDSDDPSRTSPPPPLSSWIKPGVWPTLQRWREDLELRMLSARAHDRVHATFSTVKLIAKKYGAKAPVEY